jgi:PAS domain S-box-containing protein
VDEKDSILFVDDDRNLCESLSLIMDVKGYDTEIALTARAAIEKVEARWFNLAVVDIKLSDMTGLDLLARIKEICPDMAVIVVTGYTSSENAVQALNLGASAYITKPVDMDELLAVITQIIEKQRLVFENRHLFAEVQHELAERKRAEELYETLANSSQAGIWIIQSGKFKFVNPEFCRITAFDDSEILTGDPLSLVHPDDREMVHSNATAMLKGNLAAPYEYRIVGKDGVTKIVLEAVTSIRYKGKRAAMGSCLDVSEHKQDEAKIERLSSAVEQSIDGIVITELDRNIAYANSAYSKMHGYKADKLVGMNIIVLNAENNPLDFEKISKDLVEHGSWSGEIESKRKDGSVFPAFVSVTLLRNAKGDAAGVLSVVRDVMDRKKLENRLLEVDRMKSEFIANTSHELRTPLQSVMGFAKLLLSGRVEDPQKQEEFLRIIDKQSEHLVTLIDDLIDVQRLESGKFHVDKHPVRIDEIIAEAANELHNLADERYIEIVQETDPSLPDVSADRLRIKQVIVNLLNNAIKFSNEHGKIWFKADIHDSNLLIHVVDEGIGIPKEAIGRIFERFQQVDGSLTRRAQGTGLGLYIVKQIVEAHGGRVWVESVENKGSTFSLTLPL